MHSDFIVFEVPTPNAPKGKLKKVGEIRILDFNGRQLNVVQSWDESGNPQGLILGFTPKDRALSTGTVSPKMCFERIPEGEQDRAEELSRKILRGQIKFLS